MSNVAKLKKKAAELELKRQFDKAIAVYVELLESFDQHMDELDVALFNRVGDLLVRQGNIADAVNYYEKAVDYYTDGGFFNNAIALCNKILRHSPGRTSIHYKLGRISAKKGFKSDAKQNFLEYADRMQKSGNLDEAFRALKEFADLCPDQDDIRLMLADQLSRQNRKTEAIEQLQLLHERYIAEGRGAEALATARRMKTIDPEVQPRAASGQAAQKTGDLVFIDLNAPTPRGTPMTPMTAMPPGLPARRQMPTPPPTKQKSSSPALPFIKIDDEPVEEPSRAAGPAKPKVPAKAEKPPKEEKRDSKPVTPEPPPEPELPPDREPQPPEDLIVDASLAGPDSQPLPMLEGLTRVEDFIPESPDLTPSPLLGLVPTRYEDDTPDPLVSDLLDLETTGRSPLDEDVAPIELDAPEVSDEPVAPSSGPVHRSGTPTHGASTREGGDLDFIVPDEKPRKAPRTSQEILAELEPPLVRKGSDAAPAAPAQGKHRPGKGAPVPPPREVPDEPLIPSLTLDDQFAKRFEEASAERENATDRPSWETGTPSSSGTMAVIDPDDETEGSTVAPRGSTMIAAQSVEMLEAAVEGEPSNWVLRRQLGEAMLESGDREGGIRELEAAMSGAERAGDLDLAGAMAEEIARIDPGTIRHHQKRVEFAFRTNDKPRLIEAYIALAEALMRTEQVEKSRAVYQRVLDLAPDDIRAQAALETFTAAEAAQAARKAARRAQSSGQTATNGQPEANGRGDFGNDFVNLGDWLREDEGPKDTRMVVPEHEPTGDEEADFQDMLRKFKQGIAQNVDETDHQAHYDLGVAFKEMGLLDEAIAEFQKALRSPTNRVPTYEALGQCFMEKDQFAMAHTVLSRALHEKSMSDDQLVGVLYLLGRSAEAMGKNDEALTFYQRVFVVDITFRDVADRISQVERAFR